MLEHDEASGQITLQIPVRLRLARREDLPKLEWAGQYAHFRNLYRRAFREQQQGRRLMLLAECNGHPIGQIFIQLSGHNPSMVDGANRAYLYAFRVMDRFRGQGIGTWLIHAAEAALANREIAVATIAVGKDNLRACGYTSAWATGFSAMIRADGATWTTAEIFVGSKSLVGYWKNR